MTTNLAINVGEDFYAKVWVRQGTNKTSKNLTGAVISGGIKSSYSDIEPVVSFSVEPVDLAGGIFELRIPRPVVARLQVTALATKQTKFVYDVDMKEASGKTTRLLDGTITTNLSVSAPLND